MQLEPLTWIIKKGQIGGLWTNSFCIHFFYSLILFKNFLLTLNALRLDTGSSVHHRSHPVHHFFRLPTRTLRYSSLQPLKSYKIIKIVYIANKQLCKKRSNTFSKHINFRLFYKYLQVNFLAGGRFEVWYHCSSYLDTLVSIDPLKLVLNCSYSNCWVYLVAWVKKNLPTMQETWVQSLGWEDPLEKEMATHSLVAQTVKCLPTVWETGVQSLGQEDILEKEMVTHSSILAWKIPWTEESGKLQSMGLRRVGHDWATSLLLSSVLAQRIPWTEEPSGLQSKESQRVRHNWAHSNCNSKREQSPQHSLHSWHQSQVGKWGENRFPKPVSVSAIL